MRIPQNWVLANNALVEQLGDHQVIYGRWNRMFGCWFIEPRRRPRSILPTWRLLDRRGDLAVQPPHSLDTIGTWDLYGAVPMEVFDKANEQAWLSEFDPETLAGASTLSPEPQSETLDPLRAFIQEIPRQVRLVAGAFPERQWWALEAMWREPLLIDLMRDRPGRLFALACFEALGELPASTASRKVFFAALATMPRHLLLGGLLGREVSKADLKLMLKLAETAVSRRSLLTLLDLNREPGFHQTIGHAAHLTHLQIEALAVLSPELRTRGVLAGVQSKEHLGRLTEVLGLLRHLAPDQQPLVRAKLARSARQIKSGSHLSEVLDRWRWWIADHVIIPPAPFQALPPLRPLTTVEEIRREGKVMFNCLGNLDALHDLLAGKIYYLAWEGPVRATVEVFEEGGVWCPWQSRGFDNEPLEDVTEDEIIATVMRSQGIERPPQ